MIFPSFQVLAQNGHFLSLTQKNLSASYQVFLWLIKQIIKGIYSMLHLLTQNSFSGLTAIHQFCSIGNHAFVTGASSAEELGQFQKRLNKQRKMEVIHIAVCKLLSDYGYYEFDFVDEDGWPHYKLIKKLPNLKPGEQTILMKKAIINYFIKSNYIN